MSQTIGEKSTEQEYLLTRMQDMWLNADWNGLSQTDFIDIEGHPEQGKIAILIAVAHNQKGAATKALDWGKKAMLWGCDKDELGRMLIGGVHNSIGICAALIGDEVRMRGHFEKSVSFAKPDLSGIAEAGRSRSVHQLAQMSQLKVAADIVAAGIRDLLVKTPPNDWLQNQATILNSELGILQYGLSLAHQRGQLVGDNRENIEVKPNSLEEAEARWLQRLERGATSQLGQDLWVLQRMSYKRGGYFVEFGATNGILLSNTFLLEKEFGWRGLCAEPNPRFYKQLAENRLCTLSRACIAAVSGESVEFVFAEEYGGMVQDADSDNHTAKRQAYKDAGETAILQTISLHDFLTKNEAPQTIDYISIDTEGSEFSILENFPFAEWDVKLFTIEHNFTEQRKWIRDLLEDKGYACVEAEWDDWYYKIE